MATTRIGRTVKPLAFTDEERIARIHAGAICTILKEQTSGLGADLLLEVMFVDGVRRFVKAEDIRESSQ